MQPVDTAVRGGVRLAAVAIAVVATAGPFTITAGRLAPGSADPRLRYVANAGVLVSKDGSRVLIDAPIRGGIAPYATSDAVERERLEGALPPYAEVDAILITHWHEDHFDADAVAAHLVRNPRAVLISSPEVVQRVRSAAPHVPPRRLHGVLPAPGRSQRLMVGRLAVRVLRMRHNPTRRLPHQHVGFLLGEANAILHTGDADPSPANFSMLRELPSVDLALLPFWYVISDANRRVVCDAIAPRRIAALHVPPADAADTIRRLDAPDRGVTVLGTPATDVVLPATPGGDSTRARMCDGVR